jgi:hypothetical protein
VVFLDEDQRSRRGNPPDAAGVIVVGVRHDGVLGRFAGKLLVEEPREDLALRLRVGSFTTASHAGNSTIMLHLLGGTIFERDRRVLDIRAVTASCARCHTVGAVEQPLRHAAATTSTVDRRSVGLEVSWQPAALASSYVRASSADFTRPGVNGA